MHPARTIKRAVTPKPIKRAHRAMHPVSNAKYSFERSLNTKPRRRASKAPTYQHGTCTVKHRTEAAATNCQRTY